MSWGWRGTEIEEQKKKGGKSTKFCEKQQWCSALAHKIKNKHPFFYHNGHYRQMVFRFNAVDLQLKIPPKLEVSLG